MKPDAAAGVLQVLRNYFAPDALGVVNQDVGRSVHFDCTTRMMGENLVKFDSPRRKGESRTQMDGASPDTFVPVL